MSDYITNEIEKKEREIKNLKAEIEQLKDKKEKLYYNVLLDALIIGAGEFKIRHGMIAPYTHGYEVRNKNRSIVTWVRCGNATWIECIPKLLYKYLVNEQCWTVEQFENLKEQVNEKWSTLPSSYDPDKYTPSKDYLHGNYIANGYETDGFSNIIAGRCGGTYSSMTTTAQNELARQLIVLKGFCPDGYPFNNSFDKSIVSDVYARHGIDADLSDLDVWAKRNPTRCMNDNPNFVRP